MKLIYCPCNDEEEAEKIGQTLVEEKLVACTNTMPINSCYLWEGETRKAEEYVLIAKTTEEKAIEAINKIKKEHSYKIPAIIVIHAEVNIEYENWMRETLNE